MRPGPRESSASLSQSTNSDTSSRLLSSVPGGELRRFGLERTFPPSTVSSGRYSHDEDSRGRPPRASLRWVNLSMYAVPPVTFGRVTLPEGLDPCGPTSLRGRRAARCPGSHGTSQRDEASNKDSGP